MSPGNAENIELYGAWPFVWRVRMRLPERFGQGCRVTARGALNSARVEFPDGRWFITSRWYVRRQKT